MSWSKWPHPDGSRRVDGAGLPAVPPDRTGAEHRVELRLLGARTPGIKQDGAHVHALDRTLRHSLDRLRRFDAEQTVQRGHHIHRVHVGVAHSALFAEALRPGKDHRVCGAALPGGVLLVHLERRVEGHRPAVGEVWVGPLRSELVPAPDVVRQVLRDAVVPAVLVDGPLRSAFGGGPVVRHGHDDGVLELAGAFEEVKDSADLGVGVGGECRVDLGLSDEQQALVFVDVVPGAYDLRVQPRCAVDAGLPGQRIDVGQLQMFGKQSPELLAAQHDFPVLFVPHVERASIPVRPFAEDVVWGVTCARTEIHHPRFVGSGRPRVGQELDRTVGQVFGKVIPVIRPGRRVDLMIVVPQVWIPLVGQAAQKPVEAVESPLDRPGSLRCTHRHLRRRRQMPLSDRHRVVSACPERLGDESVLPGDHARDVRETVRELPDGRHAVGAGAASGKQTRSRGRAQCRRVELRELHAPVGDALHVRHLDQAAVEIPSPEAHVVPDDIKHIRCPGPRFRLHERLPVRYGVTDVMGNPASK